MIDRKYPIVQDIKIADHFTGEDKLNLNKIGYNFAFTFEGSKGVRLDDPKYVKILVRYTQLSNGLHKNQRLLKYRSCTEDDMKKFNPVGKNSEKLLHEINTGADRGFFCIDEPDDLEVYGNFSTDNNSYVEIQLLPCNMLFTEWGYEGDTVSDECIWDQQKQQEYLEGTQIFLYFNEDNYNSTSYGENAIVKESKISKYFISNKHPSWFEDKVKTSKLIDNTDYL